VSLQCSPLCSSLVVNLAPQLLPVARRRLGRAAACEQRAASSEQRAKSAEQRATSNKQRALAPQQRAAWPRVAAECSARAKTATLCNNKTGSSPSRPPLSPPLSHTCTHNSLGHLELNRLCSLAPVPPAIIKFDWLPARLNGPRQ